MPGREGLRKRPAAAGDAAEPLSTQPPQQPQQPKRKLTDREKLDAAIKRYEVRAQRAAARMGDGAARKGSCWGAAARRCCRERGAGVRRAGRAWLHRPLAGQTTCCWRCEPARTWRCPRPQHAPQCPMPSWPMPGEEQRRHLLARPFSHCFVPLWEADFAPAAASSAALCVAATPHPLRMQRLRAATFWRR